MTKRAAFGGPRLGAVGIVVTVALVAAACGSSRSSSSAASHSAASAAYRAGLAYAKCMRAHGLRRFPDPPATGFAAANPPIGKPNSPAARASSACQHLLHSIGAGGPQTPTAGSPPAPVDCLTTSQCYSPQQFRVAYGITPLLDRGITGRGVTVVLPEEAETGSPRLRPVTDILQSVTDIRKDLAAFDSRFGLPPARIQAIRTVLAGGSDSPWLASVEEVEDTELVHAVAPYAAIRVLPVQPADVSNPGRFAANWATAVRIAARHGEVISQSGIGQNFDIGERSWTRAEVTTINSALQYATGRRVTVIVASGDSGVIGNDSSAPVRQVSLPASNPLTLAAGGTTLAANPKTGAYRGETAWNVPGELAANGGGASGGGFSHLFARPAYQDGVPGIGAHRGVPDVAGDAGSGTGGMALVFTAPGGGSEVIGAGGTSAAAPFWAGLIALADQDAGHALGFVNPAIYRIARSPLYRKAFHDTKTGNDAVVLNGHAISGYRAGPGWDPLTGWGSPDAQNLIPLLARHRKS